MSITVTTQAELDKALASKTEDTIYIESPRGVWLDLSDSKEKDVVVRGSASVRASGSASVSAFDSASVSAFDSASVSAFGSASVRAFGSASVRASGSASVSAFGSASVSAFGSASVSASDSASVSASKYVAVHLHSARVKHEGGVLIDVTNVDLTKFKQWAEYHGVEVIDGHAVLYKAVDDKLKSGRGFPYPIGETVEAPDWKAGDFCGNGLHFSPTPHQANAYFREATRFLQVHVPVKDLDVIDGELRDTTPKAKARKALVVAEVDVHGRPVKSAAVRA